MRFVFMVALVIVLVPAGRTRAQEGVYVDVPVQGRENVSFAYADVLRAIPSYELIRVVEMVETCDELPPPGAVAETGTDAEADAGQDRRLPYGADSSHGELAQVATPEPNCRQVPVEHEERRINGYEVEYRYKGELYMSRMDVDPGNKLRIRVTVAPAD